MTGYAFPPLTEYTNYDETYEPLAVYIGYFRQLPNIKWILQTDIDKATRWVKNNLKTLIIHEHNQLKHFRGGKIIQHGATIFVLEGQIMISLDKEDVRIYYPNKQKEEADRLVANFRQFPNRIKKNTQISLVNSGFKGLETTNIDLNKSRVVLKSHYNDDLIELHPAILKSLRLSNTCGLFLFHGAPGTGKSTYIRHIIHQLKKKVILLTPQLAANLDSPGLTNLLIENRNSVFIIEDAEKLLISRNQNPQSGISMLLNLSDGILGDSLGIQVIATFNTHLQHIDQALLRKGRLKFRYEFKPLCIEKSRALLNLIGKSEYLTTKPMTLAEIYNTDINDYQWRESERKIGFVSGQILR